MPNPVARYLLTSRFRQLTIMPGEDLDLIDSQEQGWVQAQLDLRSAWIDSRLAKRYAAPFGSGYVTSPQDLTPLRKDVPEIIELWLRDLVTPACYARRGVNPSSGDLWFVEFVINPYQQAMRDILEAADAEKGLFELPLRGDALPGGEASRSGPKVYTESSPYVWMDRQYAAGIEEDASGDGTT